MLVQTVLYIIAIYFACGCAFMVPFILKGVDVIDEDAHGSSIGFRLIIIPGVIVFWIVLLRKWIRRNSMGADGDK